MTASSPPPDAREAEQYIVVARRYRPQSFGDLVGQDAVSQALSNAITTQRVGHAYLFTGARGVGKTSTARILAKALNCVRGPTPTPCGECDICRGVTAGEDVDVIEIDGASNRGIDEIRQLRANVGIRPSRARYKIYIIDEVHMLTTQAFNALLKTLEEPPEHVKFIFCTTDPEKIPITVLSRCQRFDFSPVEATSIVGRLEQIVAAEGLEADAEALELIARRANGSMRDSQSLLEQLLSLGGKRITVDDVHEMLGTARSAQLEGLTRELLARNAAGTLAAFDAALQTGVDPGQLVEQLLGYLRDAMAAAVGCEAELMLHTSRGEWESLRAVGERWGLETLLAAAQILDQTLVRMRQSPHPRILAELALLRMCALERLDDLLGLVRQMQSGGPALAMPPRASVPAGVASSHVSGGVSAGQGSATPEFGKKKRLDEPFEPSQPLENRLSPTEEALPRAAAAPSPTPAPFELTESNLPQIWDALIAEVGGMVAEFASHAKIAAILAPNRLVARFSGKYNSAKSAHNYCSRPEVKLKLENILHSLTGIPATLDLELAATAEGEGKVGSEPVANARQLQREAAAHPLVAQAVELFGAEITDVVLRRPTADETPVEAEA